MPNGNTQLEAAEKMFKQRGADAARLGRFYASVIKALQAKGYLRRAAGRHNPIAENRLAHLYLGGRGVPKDLVLAEVWNGLAKAAGQVMMAAIAFNLRRWAVIA